MNSLFAILSLFVAGCAGWRAAGSFNRLIPRLLAAAAVSGAEIVVAAYLLSIAGLLGAGGWFISLLAGILAVLFFCQPAAVLRRPFNSRGMHWIEKFGALALLVIMTGWLAFSFNAALFTPPAHMDSLTYHLPRAAHWVQAHSLAHFPTANVRQNALTPGAEILIAWIMSLTRSDQAVALLQWGGLLLLLGAVYEAARRTGSARIAAMGATGVLLLAPVLVTQSYTTQNDLLASAWLLTAVALALQPEEPAVALFSGLAFGLATVTKGHLLILTPVWLLLPGFGGAFPSRRWWQRRLLALGTMAVLLSYPAYLNFAAYGHGSGPEVLTSLVVAPGWNSLIVNLSGLFSWTGAAGVMANEDLSNAGSWMAILFASGCLLACRRAWRTRSTRLALLLTGFAASLLGSAFLLRANPWTARLFVPALALGAVASAELFRLRGVRSLGMLIPLCAGLAYLLPKIARSSPVHHLGTPAWRPALGTARCAALAPGELQAVCSRLHLLREAKGRPLQILWYGSGNDPLYFAYGTRLDNRVTEWEPPASPENPQTDADAVVVNGPRLYFSDYPRHLGRELDWNQAIHAMTRVVPVPLEAIARAYPVRENFAEWMLYTPSAPAAPALAADRASVEFHLESDRWAGPDTPLKITPDTMLSSICVAGETPQAYWGLLPQRFALADARGRELASGKLFRPGAFRLTLAIDPPLAAGTVWKLRLRINPTLIPAVKFGAGDTRALGARVDAITAGSCG